MNRRIAGKLIHRDPHEIHHGQIQRIQHLRPIQLHPPHAPIPPRVNHLVHSQTPRAKKEKRFFFEKKKQKTFAPAGVGPADAKARRTEVFFASFLFTKKKCFLPSQTL
jgi:hypothetical protein